MSILTHEEVLKAAKELAQIYNSVENTRVDPVEKEKLYYLAVQYPEIHYQALRINKGG